MHRKLVSRFAKPDLGIGVGFRIPHYRFVVEERPEMDWFEIISENFMVDGGSPLYYLSKLAASYPVIPHGVGLSSGSEVDEDHENRLCALVNRLDPPWFSDHLCFSGSGGIRVHDLVPLPYMKETADHVVSRICRIQDRTGRLFALENVSSYLTYSSSIISEWDFYAEIVERADCAMLLDVNNVFVSASNHAFDPEKYLNFLPSDRVVQIHLAGHSVKPTHRLDTHDAPVCEEVWELYRAAIKRFGSVSTLIEWDGNIPEFSRLQEEAALANTIRNEALSES